MERPNIPYEEIQRIPGFEVGPPPDLLNELPQPRHAR